MQCFINALATSKRQQIGPPVSKFSHLPSHHITLTPNNVVCRVNITSQQRKNSSTARCSAVSSAAVTSTSSSDSKPTLTAALLLIITDIQLRSPFTKYSIAFPSSLAGCGALFLSMLALDTVSDNRTWGEKEKVYQLLNPGAILSAKWLPVFFVPSLITCH